MSSENPSADHKGSPLNHSTYEVTGCVFTKGVEFGPDFNADIRPILKYIKIHENIFSPFVTCELGIRDDLNFLEEFDIRGNETILLELTVQSYNYSVRTVTLELFVKEYSDYHRDGKDSQTQTYIITAIPYHAYIAPLLKISRSDNETLSTEIIRKILTNDLNVAEDSIYEAGRIEGNSTCITRFKKTIAWTNPLKEAVNVANTALDDKRTPFLFYQILPSALESTTRAASIMLTPLSYLTDREKNPVYKTFTVKAGHKTDRSSSQDNYLERSTTIEKVSSNINISPLRMSKKGVFSRTVHAINIGSKSHKRNRFEQNSLNSDYMTSKKIDEDSSRLPSIAANSTQLKSFEDAENTIIDYEFSSENIYNGPSTFTKGVIQAKAVNEAYINAYDTCTHSFTVLGDTLLNPGRTIRLLFPKAMSPTANKITDFYDRLLSGDYMIFSTVHTFMDGKYSTEVVAKTDGLNQYLTGNDDVTKSINNLEEIMKENAIVPNIL